jgi:hypothetical protein
MFSKQPTTPYTSSVGFAVQQVTVREILPDRNMALCLDNFGYEVRVTLHPLSARRMPLVGEKWMVDRKFGPWSFVAPMTNYVPVVSGDRADLSVVIPSLLDALSELGLIDDQTTEGPS